CTSTQTATDTVYRSGFRYGRRWKVVAAAMFVLEGSTAAFMYFGDNRDKVDTQLAMGFLALDAIGTAVIALIPRKEVHRRDEEPVTSPLRTGCPAGLLVEIAGETFPVDAAGRIGEIGEAALDEWMRAPSPAGVRVSYHNRTVDLQIGQNELCTWNRDRHQDQSACPSYWAQSPMVSANLEVPLGTLTRAD
ncbi:MAG TPA: hypothetical protein VK427_15465, partial [Kofleriaceae bacterium]|nr:hypothetical protein [Kofleriaceae bacterium]